MKNNSRKTPFKALWVSPELHSYVNEKAKQKGVTAGEVVESCFPEAPKRKNNYIDNTLSLFSNGTE